MRALLRLSLVTASLCAAVLVVEVLCRVYVYALPQRHSQSLEEQVATPTPAYRHADYHSLEFLVEKDAFNAVFIAPPDRSHLVLADFSGKFLNIVGGLRVTTDQPTDASRRMLMFGGSTLFSHEVPDRYTVPSFIQRSANAFCPDKIAVFNYGVPGMNAMQQAARLKTIEIHKGDVAVFYDGFNDVFYTVLTGTHGFDPEGPHLAPAVGYAVAWSRRAHATADRWRNASALAEVVARAGDRSVPETVSDRRILSGNLSIAREDYRRALTAAHELTASAGAGFFHFLQPHLYATPLATTYRLALADDYRYDPPGLDRALYAGYPVLGEAIAEARTHGVVSVDLSRIFDTRAVPDEVFLDYIHVNHKGNEIIAAAMFKEIGPALGCRQDTVSRD